MKKTPWIAGAAVAASLAAVAAYAAPDGPPKTRAEVQARVAEHFKTLDANKDGYVTQAEADAARAAMREKFTEARAERREERFAMLDTDKNGSLSKSEYLAPPPPRGDGKGDRDGKPGRGMHRGDHGHGGHGMMGRGGGMGGQWFARADADKDGKVSLAEASAGALAMFDRVDTNHDGTISAEEHDAARAAMRAKWQERRDANKG